MLPATYNRTANRGISPINRLFDQFLSDDDFLTPLSGAAWRPMPLSLWEDENHIHVEADMPGLKEGDIDVTVHAGELVIRGERKLERKTNGYDTRSYGKFEQRVTLPADVDADNVEAKLTDGVLRLAFPKSEAAKPKRISIKSE